MHPLVGHSCELDCNHSQKTMTTVLFFVFFLLFRYCELWPEVNTASTLQPLHQIQTCGVNGWCLEDIFSKRTTSSLYLYLLLCYLIFVWWSLVWMGGGCKYRVQFKTMWVNSSQYVKPSTLTPFYVHSMHNLFSHSVYVKVCSNTVCFLLWHIPTLQSGETTLPLQSLVQFWKRKWHENVAHIIFFVLHCICNFILYLLSVNIPTYATWDISYYTALW